MNRQKYDWRTEVPQTVLTAIDRLINSGFQAYLVGGAVRDLLIDRKPKDFDIVTDATPDQVQKIFKRTIPVGADFGVVIVLLDNEKIEVATFRADGEYKDGRHPETVTFSSAQEDAKRRDFTINGLFWDSKTFEIIDYVGGLPDLHSKVIRTIGSAEKRFQEDALRMLRAIRFCSQLPDFSLDPETLAAISINRSLIKNVSRERISEEFSKVFFSGKSSIGFELLGRSGLAELILSNTVNLQDLGKVLDEIATGDAVSIGDGVFWGTLQAFGVSFDAFILSRNVQRLAKKVALADFSKVKNLSIAKLKRALADKDFLYCLNGWAARTGQADIKRFCKKQRQKFIDADALCPKPFFKWY